MKTEQTLVIIKHDGVARGLMGQIIKRFERVGLKLVALEFIESTQDMGLAHYPPKDAWLETVGNRTLTDYKEKGLDAKKELGTDDAKAIGMMVRNWLVEYLAFGPVLAMIWEGPSAVKIVRKLIGDTRPALALPGTIRGDFGIDNPDLANAQRRPMYNLIHASGEIAEAEQEIELWFGRSEILNYSTYSSHYIGYEKKMNKDKKKS
jgi:nucleoside-diphosphate kinase